MSDRDTVIAELMGMGFDHSQAIEATNQPGCDNTQSAVNWILGFNTSDPSLGPRLVLDPTLIQTNTAPIANESILDPMNTIENAHQEKMGTPSSAQKEELIKGRMSKFEGRDTQIDSFHVKEREKLMLEMQRKKEIEAKEKERVKKLLEEDRRNKEEKKKKAQAQPQPQKLGTTSEASTSTPVTAAKKSEFCLLRIRLSDGKQVQSKFLSAAFLSDVNRFVVESGEPHPQFYLMQSFPNKSFKGIDCSLEEAGLCPSASLVVHKLVEEVIVTEPKTDPKEEDMEVDPTPSTSNQETSQPIPSEEHNQRLEKIRNAWADAEQNRRFQPAPEPAEVPQEEMVVDQEPVPQADLEMRQRLADIASRRYNDAPQPIPQPQAAAHIPSKIFKIPRLEHLCLKVVSELVSSKNPFNPLKTMRGTTSSVGEMIAKHLMTDRKLDHFALKKLLPCHLRYLKFDGYPLTTNQLLEVSGKHLSLIQLSARSSQFVTDEGVLKLGELRNLSHLDLGFCILTDRSLPAIINMKKLSYLNMQGTKITDTGMKSLVDNIPGIEQADFGSCPNLTSLSLVFIAEWKNLHTLNLEKTKLTDITGLRNCRNLEILNISRNALLPDKFSAISSCSKLLNLNILNTGLYDEDIVVLKSLPALQVISFPSRALYIDPLLKIFSALPLVELDLDSFTELTDEGVSYLPYFSSTLKKLSLSNTKITNKSVAYIAELKNLQELYMDRVHITSEFFARLKDFPKLEVLSLSETLTDNSAACKIIVGLRESLKSLNLSHTPIRNRTLDTARSLKKLFFLNVSGSDITTEHAQIFAQENPQIKFKRDGLPVDVLPSSDD